MNQDKVTVKNPTPTMTTPELPKTPNGNNPKLSSKNLLTTNCNDSETKATPQPMNDLIDHVIVAIDAVVKGINPSNAETIERSILGKIIEINNWIYAFISCLFVFFAYYNSYLQQLVYMFFMEVIIAHTRF